MDHIAKAAQTHLANMAVKMMPLGMPPPATQALTLDIMVSTFFNRAPVETVEYLKRLIVSLEEGQGALDPALLPLRQDMIETAMMVVAMRE